jgi:hypothetical protein
MANSCLPCGFGPDDQIKKDADCGIVDKNPINSAGDCKLDDSGKPIIDDPDKNSTGPNCVKTPQGLNCPPSAICNYWDMVNSPEYCLIANIIEENLNIGGADINVHRLLGVHEQGSLVDQVGLGMAISNGDLPNFPAINAFDKFITEWRSKQTGNAVITSAFIGYDFGPIYLSNGRERYGIDTFIKKDVTKIKIKQGCDKKNRATKIRLERSSNGKDWFGVSVLNIPDCDGLVTLDVKKSVPSRYWRIRPLLFNGGKDDYWSVQALQLIDYEDTAVSNIQDRLLLENRDRDYDEKSIKLKGSYTPPDTTMNVTQFGGLFNTNKYVIEVSFQQVLTRLGRPFVVGDIIQLPSETTYTPDLRPVLKYLEVEDVAWSSTSYTPTWVPTLQRLICSQALASQETQDIYGKLTPTVDSSGLFDINDGNNQKYQDLHNIRQTIEADANTRVPQEGIDYAEAPKLSEELLQFSKQNNMNLERFDRIRKVQGVDALPPNGLPYTEGPTFPTNPKDNDYHRVTYDHVGKDIPARLYRWSSFKNSWIYLETDRRFQMKNTKSVLEEFKKESPNKIVSPVTDIEKNLNS